MIPICGVLLCKWSEISVSAGISLPPSLVAISWCCALYFFICIMFYIQHGKSQLCGDPVSLDQACIPPSSHHTSVEML